MGDRRRQQRYGDRDAASGAIHGSVQVTVVGLPTVPNNPVPAAVAAVAALSVTPTVASLVVAGTTQLSATPRDAQGNALTGRVVTWSSSNSVIASVSSSGLVLGLTLGSTTLTATVDGVSTSVTISLCPAVVASLSIGGVSGPLSLLSGLLPSLTAQALDANGHPIAGRTVTWSVTPANKALISLLGILTPLGIGSITVTATIDGVQASTTITIVL